MRLLEQTKVDKLTQLAALQVDVAADLLPPDQEVRMAIVRAIAVNYMKPTTGTTEATITTDTNNDANRLNAAVKAVERIVRGEWVYVAPVA